MSVRPSKIIFDEVAILRKIDPSFVEKDWFVTQVIKIIGEIKAAPIGIIFSGGTALSKAHGLLERFSEDIDFRVCASEELCTRRVLSDFKGKVISTLRAEGFEIESNAVKASDENRFFSIDLDYDSHYSSPTALRSHVQLELTVRPVQLPPAYLAVSSFVNAASGKSPEVEKIGCIDPAESAADKLSAIAWRIPTRVRNGPKDDPSVVRHLYDLAILKEGISKIETFSNLVKCAMKHDTKYLKNWPDLVNKPLRDRFVRMFEILDSDKKYSSEYDQFTKGFCYSIENAPPNFSDVLKAVHALAKTVNF